MTLNRTTIYVTIIAIVALGCIVAVAKLAPDQLGVQAPLIVSLATGTILILQKMRDTDSKTIEAASKVANTLTVATDTTTKKLDVITEVAHKTYDATNSVLAASLRSIMELTAWKAEQTKDTPEGLVNMEAARVAIERYQTHMAAQAEVDKRSEQRKA